MNMPRFTAGASLYQTSGHYHGGGTLVQSSATVRPAQIQFFDPCLFGANIKVGWQPFHDGRNGVVIVTGSKFASYSGVRVRFDNCSGAFPEREVVRTNACGEFTMWHTCTCAGPPIMVEARDTSGNSDSGTVRPFC